MLSKSARLARHLNDTLRAAKAAIPASRIKSRSTRPPPFAILVNFVKFSSVPLQSFSPPVEREGGKKYTDVTNGTGPYYEANLFRHSNTVLLLRGGGGGGEKEEEREREWNESPQTADTETDKRRRGEEKGRESGECL